MGEGRTLYARLGGYDAIAAVCNDLLPRLMGDAQLGRFWRFAAARGRLGRSARKYPLIGSISPSSVLSKSAAETGFDCSVGLYGVARRYS